MVHLTFIRFAEITDDGSISLKSAKQLYLLAKILVDKFGKPQVLYTAGDDGGLQSGKIANLACTAHGIHESIALGSKAPQRDTAAFIDFVTNEAQKLGYVHLVLVASHRALNQVLHENIGFGNSLTLSAENWTGILHNHLSAWSPLTTEPANDDEARETADKLFNLPCSTDESLLVERTIAAFELI